MDRVQYPRVTLITLLLLLASTLLVAYAASDFTLVSVTQYSSAGTQRVYPGSMNARLLIQVRYEGNSSITGVYACLYLPQGFTLNARCSPAFEPGGDSVSVVSPGEIIEFRFIFDVERSVPPGSYDGSLTIEYILNGSKRSETLYIPVAVRVYPYPSINFEVVEAWWEPAAYPGSQGVSLNILVRNTGEARVEGFTFRVSGPEGFRIYTPSGTHGALGVREETVLTISRVSVDPRLAPGWYWFTIRFDAHAVTEDGVEYTLVVSKSFRVYLSPPPDTIIDIVDYGLEGVACRSAINTRLYVTLLNRDPDSTIEAVIARFRVLAGGFFENTSSTYIAVYTGRVGYGDTLTVATGPLHLTSTAVWFELNVTMLLEREGAEYWLGFTRRLVVYTPKKCLVNITSSLIPSGLLIYPGSSGVELELHMINYGFRSIRVVNVTLFLPEGFTPRVLRWAGSVELQPHTSVVISLGSVSLEPSVKPGVYTVHGVINGFVVSGDSSAPYNIETVLLLNVSKPPSVLWKVVGVYPSRLYAPCVDCSVILWIQLAKPVRVEHAVVTVSVPSYASIGDSHSETFVLENIEYGRAIRIELQGLRLYAVRSLVLNVSITSLGVQSGAEFWDREEMLILIPVDAFQGNITLAFVEPSAPLEGSGARLTIGIQNLAAATIVDAVVKVAVSNAAFENGLAWYSERLGQEVGYGRLVTITTPPLVNCSGSVKGYVEIRALYRDSLGGLHVYEARLSFSVEAHKPALKPELVGLETLYNGEPAPLLPGQYGGILRVYVRNPSAWRILSLVPILHSTPGIEVIGLRGSCLSGVAPGALCTLDIMLNVSRLVAPGVYPALLELKYTVELGDSIVKYTSLYHINLVVSNPELLAPKLSVVAVYWGSNPVRPLYSLQTLNVIVVNEGDYTASSVIVELYSRFLKPLTTGLCAETLQPGASCRATLQVLLEKPLQTYTIHVIIKYVYRVYGVTLNAVSESILTLETLGFETMGIDILDARWLNNWKVYPNTSNAVLQLTVVNRWPVTARGIVVAIDAPEGFNTSNVVIDLLQPYTSTTVNIYVDVGAVNPGVYKLKVKLDYVLEGGGVYAKISEVKCINVTVFDPVRDIELVRTEWVGEAPEPGFVGLKLRLLLWNKGVPVIRGMLVKLVLPEGIRATVTNSSIAVSPASYTAGVTPPEQSLPPQLAELLAGGGEGVVAVNVEAGSFVEATFTLNLHRVKVGVYNVTVLVSFVDGWGSLHTVRYTTGLVVTGSSRLINVYAPPTLRVVNGTTVFKLNVTNIGAGSIYNVYVAIAPLQPLLVPLKSLFYIPRLTPNESKTLDVELVYNPAGLRYWSGSSLEYAPLVYTVTVVYRDALGYTHVVNTTVSTLVEPFIILRIGPELEAKRIGSSIVVQGTIYNLGIATARSVAVYANAGAATGFTLIGDIDPGDQSAFRIELRGVTSNRVNLTIVYMDNYGVQHRITKVLVVEESPSPTVTSVEEGASVPKLSVRDLAPLLALVALASSTLTYLVLRRRMRG